jgi:hypoxanthine phosphoribosyltransferase
MSATSRPVPLSDDAHVWVDWAQYHELIGQLALSVQESGWQFDLILCLARGGLRVGDELSRIFDVPLAILATRSYRAEGGTVRGALAISPTITLTGGTLAGRVLLVDDLVDSGGTLAEVQAHLRRHYPDITTVRTAVLWHKACSSVTPDYAVRFLPGSPWIHQPFEIWDTIRPNQLAAYLHEGKLPGNAD